MAAEGCGPESALMNGASSRERSSVPLRSLVRYSHGHALTRRGQERPILEASGHVHDDPAVGIAVTVFLAPTIACIRPGKVARALQHLADGGRIGGARGLHGMLHDFHGVVAERNPPEHEIDVSLSKLRANLVHERLRARRQLALS